MQVGWKTRNAQSSCTTKPIQSSEGELDEDLLTNCRVPETSSQIQFENEEY